ncbi:unnamed protein product [Anisakis simplex]|uniref:Uncharacterized protein n=1 Tax=Anisakis simplex TaxID=6269 RepID=A0A3P6N3K3_ANISI|nr:unnamed protein product [Anisakis simplex]
MKIDFKKDDFKELEEIQVDGKGEQICRILKQHIENKDLVNYIDRFRTAQRRLDTAIIAIEENDLNKLKNIIDPQLVLMRDPRGLTLLHVAVCKERHEIVEYLADKFPDCINVTDEVNGRTAVHFAATQQNAIYDTLLEYGADSDLPDNDGWTAARYRTCPDRFIRPLSRVTCASSPLFTYLSFDENVFDPG